MTDDKDRVHMLRAIEVMKASRSEHGDRPDPLVGAVLVSDRGEVLAEVGRAHNRVGRHAEYELIEHVLDGKNLETTTLYVTLEPCAPGSRTPPKRGCAEWIKDARIPRVVIGMLDPFPTVNQRSVSYLLDEGIDVDIEADIRRGRCIRKDAAVVSSAMQDQGGPISWRLR